MAGSAQAVTPAARRRSVDWDVMWERYGISVVLLVTWLLAALWVPNFASRDNLLNVLRQSSFVGVAAVGMTVAIIAGTFDLSVGSTLGLAAWVAVSVAARWGVAAWCVLLAIYHWMPFDFRLDGPMVRHRLADLSWVPFAAYRTGNDLGALNQVLVKVSLAVPFGALCGLAASCRSPRRPLVVGALAMAFCGLVLSAIEAGQLFLPSRVADPTDVLVGVFGAGIGLVLALWIRRGR
jgi:ribose/xylose/arabinose/galactoside ABC-type transport system permease subunit